MIFGGNSEFDGSMWFRGADGCGCNINDNRLNMKKFKNKYRIESTRLKNWDYGWNGAYFVTICTRNHNHYFGKIEKQKMHLNKIGEMAYNYWNEIPHHFPYVQLGEFVAMPNHVHGIIIIDKKNDDRNTAMKTSSNTNKKTTGGFAGNMNPMINDNLSRMIRWYKGRMTFESRKINTYFQWQSLFYDHVIRNEKSFHIISIYIKNNPVNWNNDKFYKHKKSN